LTTAAGVAKETVEHEGVEEDCMQAQLSGLVDETKHWRMHNGWR